VTQSGTLAHWRRLDCNQTQPANPIDFKFNGVDGHGKQSLAADPGPSNGVNVIRIENNRNSSEGCTGDITGRGGRRTDNWAGIPTTGSSEKTIHRRNRMPKTNSNSDANEITREQLAGLLNEDLSREYQAIIAYVVYSQVLTGAQYMDIAAQLEIHAKQELDHALILSRQIDYLGKMPVVTPKPVRTSEDPREMLRFDLDNENETIRNYRERVRQCEALGEYAMAEQIRQILVQEQDHQIDLATALGEDVPDVSSRPIGDKPGKQK
jgi:bacterioferritin